MPELLDVPVLSAWLKRVDEVIAAQQERLCELDAAIGDGDHGANLTRGFHAVIAKLGTPADPSALFKTVGMTLISTVGGASGPLYGSMFLDMGKAAVGKPALGGAEWADVLEAGVKGVAARGKAQPGEKTMLDALVPAVAAAKAAPDLSAALKAAARATEQGVDATVPMLAKKGRASYLGERSIGHADPGATSAALLLSCLAEVVG